MSSILIMAGGSGTRFWPASRKNRPKQFLKVVGKNSMLLDTALRVHNLCPPENIFVVTTELHREAVKDELGFIPAENIIIEPEGRNTAPAIGLGLTFIKQKYGANEPVIVLPADHYIGNHEKYVEALQNAFHFIRTNDQVVTFGIQPTRPETGYGYIETGNAVKANGTKGNVLHGIRFVEKPDVTAAEKYLKDGSYLWNSGMFGLKAGTFFELCSRLIPDLYAGLVKIEKALANSPSSVSQVIGNVYNSVPSTSIDYGIMENLERFYVIPADFSWDDLGSWRSLEGVLPRDKNQNVVVGNFWGQDVEGSIVYSNNKIIAAVGLKDIVVVADDDVVMVCPKDKVQDVKKLVEHLKQEGKEDLL